MDIEIGSYSEKTQVISFKIFLKTTSIIKLYMKIVQLVHYSVYSTKSVLPKQPT